MAKHRMGARGNVTSFPLPWQELLKELKDKEASPSLPWVGAELSNYVSILLKTSEEDDPKDLRKYIHQARVRRTIVVQLIEDAHARGHRAYRNIHMSEVFVGFENALDAVTLSTGKTGDDALC